MTIRLLAVLVAVATACGIDKPIDVADSMPLRKQPVTVLLQGLNQKAPGTVGVLGQLEVAENTRIQKGTAAGIELVRRNGLVEVSDIPSGSGAYRMVSTPAGLVADDGFAGIFRYSPTATALIATGDHGAISVGRADLQAPIKLVAGTQTPTQSGLDVGLLSDRGCYVWVDQDGAVQYSIRDVGGNPVTAGALNSSGGSNTKIVALGTSWFVFWKEANDIKAAKIAASGFAITGPVAVVASGSALAGTDYDVQAGFSASSIALLYRSAAGTYVRALVSTTLLSVTSSQSDATAANQPDVALCWLSQPSFGTSLYYATLNAANGLKFQTIDATTLAITATTTEAGAPVTNVKNMAGASTHLTTTAAPFVLIDRQITDGSGVTHRVVDKVIAGGIGPVKFWSNASLASRISFLGSPGWAYVALLYNSSQAAGSVVAQQPTLLIARDIGSGSSSNSLKALIVAKAMPGTAGAHTTFSLTSLVADTAGALHGLFGHAIKSDTVAGEVVLQYELADISLTYRSPVVGAPLSFGGVTLFPGGELFELDTTPTQFSTGFGAHEQGFRIKPEIPKLTEGAAASGSIAPGTRSYIMRWKWVDSAGQAYASAWSTPVPITTVNANSSVQVSFYGPDATTKRQYVQAEIARTPLNGTGDDYFRVTPSVFSVDASTQAVATFTDTASEATLAAGEPFAVSSETGTVELENVAPPALNDICEHNGHLVGVDAEQPWRLRISKAYTAGTGLGFTDSFFMDTPDSTGPVYKVMSMDGHLIAIKRDSIYVFAGDFPDNTGSGTFPSPSLLPVGVGTDQPRSVVLTDLGVMFYSAKRGFWLLNRSLGVKYIGAPVETTAAGQTVSGATVHPTYPEVRFTTEGGTTFVLNTWATEVAGQPIWTTFTGQACVHSIVHGGDWYLLTSAGKLLKEDLTRWQDGVALGGGAFTAGAAFTRRVKVSDVNFAGVNGFARVYSGALTGEWYASEKVKITITNNHRLTDPETGLPASERPFTFDATVNPDPYVLDFFPAVQKVTAMDLQIEDTSDYQTQGSAWSALSFMVGVKGGPWRQGTSHSMSGGARKP